jgi:hypothetical protein
MMAYSSSSFSSLLLTSLLLGALPTLAACGGKVVVDGEPGAGGSSPVSVGSGEPALPTCGPKEQAILGVIDGVPLSFSVPSTGAGQREGFFVLTAEQGSHLVLFTSSSPDGSAPHADVGLLGIPVLPAGDPSPLSTHQGLWICDETGITGKISPKTLSIEPLTFTAPRSLGACPGQPVSGQLMECDNGVGCGLSDLDGVVGGQPVHAEFDGGFAGETMFQGRGLLASGGPLNPFVFLMPEGSPDPGALYCVGSADTDAATGNLVLGDLSRLGTCAEATPIAGSVSVCVGST